MKKIILSAALLFTVGFSAKAQNIKYGFKAGVNFATLTGKDAPDDLESRTGFQQGAVAEFRLSEQFSIQPELLYSQQGAKYHATVEDIFGDESLKATYRFDYINFPILAKYYIIEGLSIEAGPQIGFLLNANLKVEVQGIGEEKFDLEDTSETVDFGLAGGVAYDFSMGLFFQARYAAGLSKINDDNVGNTKNGVFSISAGFKF